MLRAEIHGKLADNARSASERSEDVLTSNVFGSFRYLPPKLALLPWLSRAEAHEEGSPPLLPARCEKAEVFFWPSVRTPRDDRGREPDVLVRLTTTEGQATLLVVECKYLSGKSQLAPDDDEAVDQEEGDGPTYSGDQLADYLAAVRAGQVRHKDYHRQVAEDRVALLFVTADVAMPCKTLDESAQALRRHHGQEPDGAVYWLSWRSAWQVLQDALSWESDEFRCVLIGDLLALLTKKELRPFTGFAWLAAAIPELAPDPYWRKWWSTTPFCPVPDSQYYRSDYFRNVRSAAAVSTERWWFRRAWASTAPAIPEKMQDGWRFYQS